MSPNLLALLHNHQSQSPHAPPEILSLRGVGFADRHLNDHTRISVAVEMVVDSLHEEAGV